MLINLIMLVLIWLFVIKVFGDSISKLARDIYSREVKVDDLMPGMMPAGVIIKKDKTIEKHLDNLQKKPEIEIMEQKNHYFISGSAPLLNANQAVIKADEGLTISQINHIKDIGFQKIKINQTIPFAPFIFFGTILTIVLNGNLLIVIKDLILRVI